MDQDDQESAALVAALKAFVFATNVDGTPRFDTAAKHQLAATLSLALAAQGQATDLSPEACAVASAALAGRTAKTDDAEAPGASSRLRQLRTLAEGTSQIIAAGEARKDQRRARRAHRRLGGDDEASQFAKAQRAAPEKGAVRLSPLFRFRNVTP